MVKTVLQDKCWNLIVILVLASCHLIESRLDKNIQSRLIHKFKECKSNGTLHLKSSAERMGSEGYREKEVPEFLGTAWMKTKGMSDVYWAGIAIGLGKNYALMHQDTYKDIVHGGNVQNANGYLNKVVIPSDLAIHVQTSGFRPGKQLMKLVKSGLGGKPFNLVRILDGDGFVPGEVFKEPVIEMNMNNSINDCRAYSWAESSKSPSNLRHFSSLPVRSANCELDTGDCLINLVPNLGNICPTSGDRGVPILCGPDKKLTYLVHDDFLDGCIEYGINAIHMASIIEDIDKYKTGHMTRGADISI